MRNNENSFSAKKYGHVWAFRHNDAIKRCEKKSHDVKLTLTEELTEEEIIKDVKDYAPNMLAYSIMTGEHIYHMI